MGAVYLPGHQHEEAVYLSWNRQDSSEWSLRPSIFSWVMTLQGPPEVILFASLMEAKLPSLILRLPHPQANAVDTLSSPWRCRSAFGISSKPVISRFFLKLLKEPVEVVATLPFWPKRPRFPAIVSRGLSTRQDSDSTLSSLSSEVHLLSTSQIDLAWLDTEREKFPKP